MTLRKPNMRILIISHSSYAPPWDEGVKNLVRYIKEFCDSNHVQTRVLSLRKADNSHSRIPFGSRLRIIYNLYKQTRDFNPDLIFLLTSCRSWLGIKTALIKLVSGNAPLMLYVTSVAKPLRGYRMFLSAKRVMVISPFLKQYFPDAGLIYPVSPLQSLPMKSPPRIRNLNEPLKVLFLGAWEPGRGIEVLIAALGKAKTRMPVHLILALNSYASLTEKDLTDVIKMHNVEDIVEIKGRVDLVEAYTNCDVVVIPRADTQRMSFPVRIIEALAMNKPLIVTTICDMGSLIEGAGIAVPPGDAEAMADAFYLMYRDRDFYKTCVENTKVLTEKYNSNASLHRLLEEFERVSGR